MRKGTSGQRRAQKRAETKGLSLLQMKIEWNPRPRTEPFQGGLRFTGLIKAKELDSSR